MTEKHCDICEKKFTCSSTLNRHIRDIHKVDQTSAKNIICPNNKCSMKFSRKVKFFKHLEYIHQIVLQVQRKEFSNMAEFKTWKDYIERKTHSKYSRKKAAHTLVNGEKIMYFDCHRSGIYYSKSRGIRQPKRSGSKKINRTCPSSMDVSFTENKVQVLFRKTHYGHSIDIADLFMSERERLKISVNLILGNKDSPVTTDDECVQVSSEIPHDMDLSSDISGLSDEKIPPDIKLNCGDRSFLVHRSVLAAQSEAFHAMFHNRMEENGISSVDIKDLDVTILESFLKFLYSGQLENLTEDTAATLYEASEKYAMCSLSKACSHWITRNLSEENCISYLIIADTHSDFDLRTSIISFIVGHPRTFKSTNWLTLSEQNPVLANKVFQVYISSMIS